MLSKADLRQHFRTLRNNLSLQEQEHAAQNLVAQIKQNPHIQTAKKIGIYIAHKNELNLNPSIELLKHQGKQIYAPILHPHHETFWFAPYQGQPTQKNKFGILEPRYQLKDLLAPWELDVILAPALAIDQKNHRLGQGQGYYDRSLAFKKQNPQQKPQLISCIYHFQVNKTDLPTEATDISMDDVIII